MSFFDTFKSFFLNHGLSPAKDLNASLIGASFLSHYLPYEFFDEQYNLLFNKNTIGFAIESHPVSSVSSEEDMTVIQRIMENMLPENSFMQVILLASPTIESITDKFEFSFSEKYPVLKTVAKNRSSFFKNAVEKNNIPGKNFVIRDFRLLFCFSFEKTEYENNISLLTGLIEKILSGIESLYLHPKVVNERRFIELFLALNGLNGVKISDDAMMSIPDKIQDSSRRGGFKEIKYDHILVGFDGKQISNYSVTDFGQHSPFLFSMSELIGGYFDTYKQVSCPFYLSLLVYIPKQGPEVLYLRTKAASEIKRAEGMGREKPSLARSIQTTLKFVEELDKNKRVIYASFLVTLINNVEEVLTHERNLLEIFNATDFKWKLEKNEIGHFLIHLFNMPFVADKTNIEFLKEVKVLKKFFSSNVSGMLPIIADYKGVYSKNPMLFLSRRGQLVSFDNYTGINFNIAVCGQSGSGKSVFCQDLILSLIGREGRMFVVDIGGSYKKICELEGIDAQYIRFSLEKPISLNPFSTIDLTSEQERLDFASIMTAILISMAGGNIEAKDRGILEQAVNKVLEEYGNEGNVSKVARFLENQPEHAAQDLAKALYPYTEHGKYNLFFNPKKTINFDAPLIVFEMEEIENDQYFLPVILSVLMYQVTQTMYLGDRKTKIGLLVDEAWRLLKGGMGGDVIESVARRARKYNGFLMTATQSIGDFFMSPSAQASWDTSYWKIILQQEAAAIDLLLHSKKISWSEFRAKTVKSVRSVRNKYSEFAVFGANDEFFLATLCLDKFSIKLYSTQAEDFKKLEELKNEGKTFIEAIQAMADSHN